MKIYKMGIFYCISLKLGICGHLIFCGKNIFPKKHFLALEVVKIEKSSYFVKKTPKTWFCTKKVKKTGENMLCQSKTLLSNMIHWFMHKNHVYNDLSWVIWCILLYFSPKWAFVKIWPPLDFGSQLKLWNSIKWLFLLGLTWK